MADTLLFTAYRQEQGIRPHSLTVTAIAALMGELRQGVRIRLNYLTQEITGRPNPAIWGLPIRGIYRIGGFLFRNSPNLPRTR